MRAATEQEKINVLFDDEIWEKVSNDSGITKDEFVFPDNWLYLTETGKEVFILSDTMQIHPNILRGSRGNAYWAINRFLDWINDNTEIPEIFAKIHTRHKNAIRLSKIGGFEEVDMVDDRVLLVKRFNR